MKKRIIAIISLILLLGVACYGTQEILKAKFMGDATTIVDGFYAEEDNSLDVIFIGSSNCFCTIDPLVLYENYGIMSYNFASSSQTISISELYLKEALKHQTPKVVVLEANYIPGVRIDEVNESSLRWGLTQIPFSMEKMRCLKRSGVKGVKEYISYIFPVLRYHERWKEVTKNDFVYHKKDKKNYAKGFLRTDEVGEGVILTDYLSEGESWLEEDMISSLDAFVALCRENNAEVVLFKSPRMNWYSYQTEAVREYASSRGIPYIDYNEKVAELGIDATSDFRDGDHLNNRGAYKVTNDLGTFLKKNYALEDHRNSQQQNSFEEALFYYSRFNPQPFMQAVSLMECNDLVAKEKDYIMVVTYHGGENAKTKEVILPHQWVYMDGKLIVDKEWKKDGVVVKDIGDIQMVLQKKGIGVQAIFDNRNYPGQPNNWSVIVYDKVIKQVVADLGFDS